MSPPDTSVGYSGTPLAKKLTLKDGYRVWFDGMPDSVRAIIDASAMRFEEAESIQGKIDAAHIFVTEKKDLGHKLRLLRDAILPDGQIWVSWPKKAAKIPTEIGQSDVRTAGLEMGLVDTKKCAVDETWSGLKFVIRKELR